MSSIPTTLAGPSVSTTNTSFASHARTGTPNALQPAPSIPITAAFPSSNLTLGAGVAIFHIATARVVVCHHTRDNYHFLPKGRRDAGESSARGACREGFEESGYRNRILPLPHRHRQPAPRIPDDPRAAAWSNSPEPVWTEFMPVTNTAQYILFWYVAETLPPAAEEDVDRREAEAGSGPFGTPYVEPPEFPQGTTLRERVALEPRGYEPRWHANTSADEEERLYKSELVDVETAIRRLGSSTVSADVVRRGWEGICKRKAAEGS